MYYKNIPIGVERMSRKLANQLQLIPKPFLFLSVLCYILPFTSDSTFAFIELKDMEWFLYLIPSFYLPYYLGLFNGTTIAVGANLVFLSYEWWEKLHGQIHSLLQLYIISIIVVLNVSIAIGIGLVTEKLKLKHRELIELSYTDPLTNLFNRRYLQDKLKDINKDQTVGVVYIDLDRFKFINDSYGHDIGDLILKEIGNRLNGFINGRDVVARIGGDEFVLLFQEIDNIESLEELVNRIRLSVSRPFQIFEHQLFVSSSIGISIYPNLTNKLENLLKSADISMYYAKKTGNNRVQIYSDEMDGEYLEKSQIEQDLHKALENSEFILHYQPKYKIGTKEMIGLEALIRWNHPQLGLISPIKFIPVAEETGLIKPIGEWVLQSVCKEIKKFQEEGLQLVRIAINVSTSQLDSSFIPMVKKIINEAEIEAKYLEIEITESFLMKDIEQTKQILHQLDQLGIYISIDDFGTGYSSFYYLKNLPIRCLKIDKSFIKDIVHEKDMVNAIISLGHHLKLDIVAEGIEDLIQYQILENQSCDFGQGYLFSLPLPIEDIKKMKTFTDLRQLML